MLKSPVYRITVPDQWGDPQRRKRCCFDGKVVLSRDRAHKLAQRLGLEAYLGICEHWHVGHAAKLPGGAPRPRITPK